MVSGGLSAVKVGIRAQVDGEAGHGYGQGW